MKLGNVLKFRILLLHLTIFAKIIESFNVDDVSRIVCHFNQFNALDIVPSDMTKQSIHVKISKKLMRTCNLKVKVGCDTKINGAFFMGFVYKGNNMKTIPDDGLIFFDQENFDDIQPSKINQDVKFVNLKSRRVYEHYEINGQIINQQLGYFNLDFEYIPLIKQSLLERRNDFRGYHLIAMAETYFPFFYFNLSLASYEENSQTFDVTNVAKGMFYDMFLLMQENLNFTATIKKRKDSKWGPTTLLANGTVLPSGIVKSVTSGFAEMIVTSMAQTVARSQAMDILPPIVSPKAEIFIKAIKDEEIYWSLFLHMFPANVWLALYLVAVIISFMLSTIKNVLSEGTNSFIILNNLMDYLWFAFKANFGGSSNQVHQNSSSRIVTFTCLFIGSLIWMLFRCEIFGFFLLLFPQNERKIY